MNTHPAAHTRELGSSDPSSTCYIKSTPGSVAFISIWMYVSLLPGAEKEEAEKNI